MVWDWKTSLEKSSRGSSNNGIALHTAFTARQTKSFSLVHRMKIYINGDDCWNQLMRSNTHNTSLQDFFVWFQVSGKSILKELQSRGLFDHAELAKAVIVWHLRWHKPSLVFLVLVHSQTNTSTWAECSPAFATKFPSLTSNSSVNSTSSAWIFLKRISQWETAGQCNGNEQGFRSIHVSSGML